MRNVVYLVEAGRNIIKIGIAEDHRKRIAELQVGSPWQLRVVHLIAVPADHLRTIEKLIHRRMRKYRLRGEWFRVSANIARRIAVRAAAQYARDQIAAYPDREQAFNVLAALDFRELPK